MMNKRFIALVSALLLAIVCSVPTTAEEHRIQVVATNFPCYDFVRALSGGRVDERMLLLPGSESHSYEPTPQDILAIQRADVFVYVGGESDAWVDSVLSSMDTSNMRIVRLMECVDAVEEETVEGMQGGEERDREGEDHDDKDHEHADEEHEYDEHVWTSPVNVQKIAAKLAGVLSEADPGNAEAYRANLDAYQAKLTELDASLRAVVAGGARDTIIFGDRFPFRYLADAYGLKYFAAFPGCATETEPSAKTVAFLIDKVREERIPVVFHIELSNEKMADTICEATGAQKLLLHACHNISKADFEAGLSYLDLMERNAEALKEALR